MKDIITCFVCGERNIKKGFEICCDPCWDVVFLMGEADMFDGIRPRAAIWNEREHKPILDYVPMIRENFNHYYAISSMVDDL
jgi:hypothetical protein